LVHSTKRPPRDEWQYIQTKKEALKTQDETRSIDHKGLSWENKEKLDWVWNIDLIYQELSNLFSLSLIPKM
jgi:hypothetical protein